MFLSGIKIEKPVNYLWIISFRFCLLSISRFQSLGASAAQGLFLISAPGLFARLQCSLWRSSSASSQVTPILQHVILLTHMFTWLHGTSPGRHTTLVQAELSQPGTGKVQPTVQICPTSCLWMVCKLKVVFTFLSGWKTSKEELYFLACEN